MLNNLLSSQLFFPNLIKGWETSQVLYVRSRFINVMTVGIYMLSSYIEENQLKDTVHMILDNYLDALENIEIDEEDLVEDEEIKQNTEI